MIIKFEKFMNSYGLYITIAAFAFVIGLTIGKQNVPEPETVTVEKPIYITEQAQAKTVTEIAYVPKKIIVEKYIDPATGKEVDITVREKTDLEANIGKQDFNIKVNNKNVVFDKTDDEKYVFDKNKISLEQSSTVTFDVKVPTQVIDNTKRWSIGVGKASESGIAYTLDFPIGQSNTFGGWIYKDDNNEAIGIKIKF